MKPVCRSEGDDTGGLFKLAARAILRCLVSMPIIDLYAPELWQWNNPDPAFEIVEEPHCPASNHLFPQP